jgi:DNA-binding transcriptional LysR family regulator
MIPRLRRNIWNWLPAFLEVAETGSVGRAARNLSVTPAAISRTLRLLQEEVGSPLFNRVGRQLVLNATGAALRDAVRSASRAVDTGLTEALGDPFVGPLRVASLGVLTEHFVVPCLIELRRAHPELVPEHVNIGTSEANAQLVRGQIDLAFYYEEVTAAGVVVERLGQTSTSIYCGREHPLFGARRVTLEQVLAHPFSVPQIGDSGRIMDGWPADLRREVGMRITLLRSNLEVCRSGALLTVLPDVTAAPDLERGLLRRLPVVELPAIELFAARHESAPERSAVRGLVDAVTARLHHTNQHLARSHRKYPGADPARAKKRGSRKPARR